MGAKRKAIALLGNRMVRPDSSIACGSRKHPTGLHGPTAMLFYRATEDNFEAAWKCKRVALNVHYGELQGQNYGK